MFLGYIHYFRALAIFFIVAGHSIDAFIWSNEDIEKILRILISNGSVLFVFIAGYLFQHLSHKFDKSKYYRSKLKNVIVPYLLISIPAILIFVTIIERESVWEGFYDYSILQQIGLFYLTGKHLAPLWFIPMISIFYLIAPILVKADKGKIIYFFLPIFIIVSCYFGRGLPHESFVHFFSIYLLGMFCSHFKTKINPLISHNLFILIAVPLIVYLAYYEFHYKDGTMTYVNYLQKLMMSVFFLGLFFKFNSYLNSKVIGTIADTSFGVFFIHSYFLTAGKLLFFNVYEKNASGDLVAYFIVATTTLFACSLIILLIKKIFGKYSKLIVGS